MIKICHNRKAQRDLKQSTRPQSSKVNQLKKKNTVNMEKTHKPRPKHETLGMQVLERMKAFNR